MSLNKLSDNILVQNTEGYVREEREVLTKLLHHFREIERRRLYCEYKYSSLHKMLVGHFGYSDDEAYRRVASMRLLRELPEIEEKINNGELSLSHLGLAQSFFNQEQKAQQIVMPKESKMELLQKISDQSIREAKRIVFSESSAPEQLRPEKISVISENKIELRFTADQKLEEKIRELKGLLAHKYPHLSTSELFEMLCDMGIQKIKAAKAPVVTATHMKQAVMFSQKPGKNPCKKESLSQIRKQVRHEGQHKCSNCHSSYAVEIDHQKPKAQGGDNSKTNLRLLCRSCNQRSAIRHLGMQKMDQYLN